MDKGMKVEGEIVELLPSIFHPNHIQEFVAEGGIPQLWVHIWAVKPKEVRDEGEGNEGVCRCGVQGNPTVHPPGARWDGARGNGHLSRHNQGRKPRYKNKRG